MLVCPRANEPADQPQRRAALARSAEASQPATMAVDAAGHAERESESGSGRWNGILRGYTCKACRSRDDERSESSYLRVTSAVLWMRLTDAILTTKLIDSDEGNTVFDSEFERNLFELRRGKLAEIEKLGQAAYPNQFPASHTIPEIRAKWGETTAETLEADRVTVTIAGRIMAIRVMGKAGFATLQQGGERLQIYVRMDAVGEQGWALYKLLDLGDHIGVSGYLFRTRTGELISSRGAADILVEGDARASGEISRAGRCGVALPAAVRRSVFESGCARSLCEAGQGAAGVAAVL